MINVDLGVFVWDWMAAGLGGIEISVNSPPQFQLFLPVLFPSILLPSDTSCSPIHLRCVFYFPYPERFMDPHLSPPCYLASLGLWIVSWLSFTLLELIDTFCKVTGYKVNTQKQVSLLCTHDKQSELEFGEAIALNYS